MRWPPWSPRPHPGRDRMWLAKQFAGLDSKMEKIMSGLTDLQSSEAQESADISTLVSVVSSLITDLQAALANTDPDAAVEAASQIVAQQDQQLQQITAQLKAADPGTQPPASS